MMLNSVLKKEINKSRCVLPFCFKLAKLSCSTSTSNTIIGSTDSNISEKSAAATTTAAPATKSKLIEENPFYAKYADKISKVNNQASKTSTQTSPDISEAKLNQTASNHLENKTTSTNTTNETQTEKKYLNKKSLKDIMNIDLLENHSADEISKIWIDYHCEKVNTIFAIIPKNHYEKIYENGKKFPFFIYPLPRLSKKTTNEHEINSENEQSTSYEFMFGQFNGHQIFFTPLIMYQTHKENAPIALAINNFPELVSKKKIVLMNGEFDENIINLLEAQCLANQIQLYYTGEDLAKQLLLYKFNKEPENFHFMDLINEFENSLIIK